MESTWAPSGLCVSLAAAWSTAVDDVPIFFPFFRLRILYVEIT